MSAAAPAGNPNPKAATINEPQMHAIYAGLGSAAGAFPFTQDPMQLGQAAVIGGVSSYLMNTTFASSMTILPHDVAAALVTGVANFYLTGNVPLALATFIGTNNAPLIAAFMKFPQHF
jgi:hypothetical protein